MMKIVFFQIKGKGMSHIRSVRWGVPVKETLVLSHRLCEVGWPVPFLFQITYAKTYDLW